jgi:hypothetical protein
MDTSVVRVNVDDTVMGTPCGSLDTHWCACQHDFQGSMQHAQTPPGGDQRDGGCGWWTEVVDGGGGGGGVRRGGCVWQKQRE